MAMRRARETGMIIFFNSGVSVVGRAAVSSTQPEDDSSRS